MTRIPDTKSAYRQEIDRVNEIGPHSATWEGLGSYTIPEWYQNSKFGIFIHWGVYAVPAFGSEWYPRNMYQPGSPEFDHHRKTYGDQASFGYKDFIPQFTAARFDPYAWARLFRQAGAQFVVPTAEHHDGFPLYDSAFTRWNAARMGPRRDLIGDLGTAVREQGMVYGVSSHRAEHWWFMNGGMGFDSDVQDPRYADFYGPAQPENLPPNDQFLEDWLVRCCEVVDKYQPQVFWFDWWIEQPVFAPYLQQFASYYYNRGREWNRGVAINFKHHAFPPNTAVYDIERGQLVGIREEFWQTDTAVAINSWGYTDNQTYKRPADLIGDLVDIVSKNGALLLNIGPRADGSIPDEDQEILKEIGRWLYVFGEAVYGTRPWRIYGEGPTEVIEGYFADTRRQPFTAADVRFTTREILSHGVPGPVLYATALAWPADGKLSIRSLAQGSSHLPGAIDAVELVTGRREEKLSLEWKRTGNALEVTLPGQIEPAHAVSLRIRAAGI